MFKLFKTSFYKTNDCLILAVPLIIFMLFLDLYISFALNAANSVFKIIFAVVTMLFLLSGCLASWFYLAKKTLALSDKVFVFENDRLRALIDLIWSLPRGVGRLFWSFLGCTSVCVFVYGLIFLLAFYIVDNFIIHFDVFHIELSNIFVTTGQLYQEINQLPNQQLLALDCWLLISAIFVLVFSFLLFLWIPEIVYSKKNFLLSLVRSVQKILITFPKTLLLYIYILLLLLVVSIINTLLLFNPFLCFIVFLITYYLFLYVVVLVFSYYEQTFLLEN